MAVVRLWFVFFFSLIENVEIKNLNCTFIFTLSTLKVTFKLHYNRKLFLCTYI